MTEEEALEAMRIVRAEKPRSRVRKSDVRSLLEKIAPTLSEAVNEGHSITSLAKAFKEKGMDASVETIRAYIGDIVGEKRATKSHRKPVSTRRTSAIESRHEEQRDHGKAGKKHQEANPRTLTAEDL